MSDLDANQVEAYGADDAKKYGKKRTNEMRKILIGQVSVDGDTANMSFFDRN